MGVGVRVCFVFFLLLLLFYLPANGAVARIGTSLFEHCFGVGDGEADVVGFGGYADVAGDEGVEVEVEGLGGGCECGEGGEKLLGGEHGCSFFSFFFSLLFFLLFLLLVVVVVVMSSLLSFCDTKSSCEYR